jgi:hypothetical protein
MALRVRAAHELHPFHWLVLDEPHQGALTYCYVALTAPVLDVTPQDVDGILDELRAYQTIFNPLFQRREQRAWAETYLHGLLLGIGNGAWPATSSASDLSL